MNDTYYIRHYRNGELITELSNHEPLGMIRHACDLAEDMEPGSDWRITVTCSNDEGEWTLLLLSPDFLPEKS